MKVTHFTCVTERSIDFHHTLCKLKLDVSKRICDLHFESSYMLVHNVVDFL